MVTESKRLSVCAVHPGIVAYDEYWIVYSTVVPDEDNICY